MLIDLISPNNYVFFNLKLANIFGLKESIYISEILNINDKAIKKNAMNGDNMIIDRDYIFSRTTITPDEQFEIEKNLSKFGIISNENNSNEIYLDIGLLASFISSDDATLKETKNVMEKLNSAKRKTKTKRECVKDSLKALINCPNEELRQAYLGWIDGVYANPKGFLSARAISIAQKTIDDFTNRDLDLALSIINIATVNGYRDMNWAINKFKENYKPTFVYKNNYRQVQ